MDQIKFDKRNYRKHNDRNKATIRKSLAELGAGRSVLLDAENSLIAGNGVFEQAQKLGIPVRVIETDGTELVAVKRTDIHEDDAKRTRLALADNATSDLSEWDVEAITADLTPDQIAEWGIELEPMDAGQIHDQAEATEDDFDEDQDAVETITQPGDVWILGNHRLLCGDSTKPEEVARLMGKETADLWLTDPPYNVALGYEGTAKEQQQRKRKTDGQTIMNDQMPDEAFRAFLTAAYGAAKSVIKPGGAWYVWHAGNESFNFIAALRENGMRLRQHLIWNKNRFTLGRQDYQWKHEHCLYGWIDGAAHYWGGTRNDPTVIGDDVEIDLDSMKKDELKRLIREIMDARPETTLIDEPAPTRSEEHPTMKPVRLFGRQIKNSSRPGEIVLDTFAGSGTTVIACEQLGRRARVMELDPHYCDVIIARWEKFTGLTATKA